MATNIPMVTGNKKKSSRFIFCIIFYLIEHEVKDISDNWKFVFKIESIHVNNHSGIYEEVVCRKATFKGTFFQIYF